MRKIQRGKHKSKQNNVLQFKEDVEKALNYQEMDVAVTLIKHKTGEVSIVTNDCDAVELIGLIEVGKQFAYENRFGSDD